MLLFILANNQFYLFLFRFNDLLTAIENSKISIMKEHNNVDRTPTYSLLLMQFCIAKEDRVTTSPYSQRSLFFSFNLT